MSTTPLTSIVQTWFDRLWNRDDPAVIDDLRAANAKSEGLGAPIESNGDFTAFYRRLRGAFATTRVEIVDSIESGDRVAYWARFHGSTRDGQSVVIDGCGFVRVAGGKVVETRNLWNIAAAATQCGGSAVSTFDELVARLSS